MTHFFLLFRAIRHLFTLAGKIVSPLSLLLLSTSIQAQPFSLLKDVNPYEAGGSSNVSDITDVNGMAYFTATTASAGKELWKSDGTEAGTVLVKDIYKGLSSGEPKNLTNVNGVLFFLATNNARTELYKSDGTEAGTVVVKDITPNRTEYILNLTNVNGVLYFSAETPSFGYELWKSDGTEAGTVMVKDIKPGTGGSEPQLLTNVNGELYFMAHTAATGHELWKTDGTDAGTVLVKDINPGTTGSVDYVAKPTAMNGVLYFNADNGTNGVELWRSDGTANGTLMVKDIRAGSIKSDVNRLTVMNGSLFFTATDGVNGYSLWKTDGTEAGTTLVRKGNANWLTSHNGLLYFTNYSSSIWKTDGTEAGTVLVRQVPGYISPKNLTSVGGLVYFIGSGNSDTHLWKTDGTDAGTVQVKPITLGFRITAPTTLANINGSLFFAANNEFVDPGNFNLYMYGAELCKSNGTDEGTVMVKDIYSGTGSSNPKYLVAHNNAIYFASYYGLWKTDGTESGTTAILSGDITRLVKSGKDLYYVKYLSPNYELWKTNGTAGAETKIQGFNVPITEMVDVNGTLYFELYKNSNTEGYLWKSDGTTAGTVQVKGAVSFGYDYLTNVNGTLFFTCSATNGNELWKSDGTEAGTVLVKDIAPGNGASNPSELVNVNGVLYFKADNTQYYNKELWKSDGTEAGTVMVKDITADPSTSSNPTGLTNINGTLYFSAKSLDAFGVTQLWKSDGTEAGTAKAINNTPYGLIHSIKNITNVNGAVYFSATNQATGEELWRTDGTDAGTVLVKDINAGIGGSAITVATAIGNWLYFSADDGTNGTEIWKSDGTEQGTKMVQDISPIGGTNVYGFSQLGNKILANLSEERFGNELWVDASSLDDPLPIHLLSFAGSKTNTGNLLRWRTSNETNAANFVVEKSSNGITFSAVGEVKAIGNGNNSYTLTDNNISANAYYRIKMLDKEGRFTHSAIVRLSFNPANNLLLYPNPVKNTATLQYESSKTELLNLRIINASGKTIWGKKQSVTEGTNAININVSGFAAGMYIITAEVGEKVQAVRMIKQ